jgi:hypothetical protein
MIPDHWRFAWDPSAPVPLGWPHGWVGVLILFCVPGGVGVPPGVLLAKQGGLGPMMTTNLYFLSDVLMACVFEPMLRALAANLRRRERLDRMRDAYAATLARMLPGGSLAGPGGIVLTGFGMGLPFGRALSALGGYGLVGGWLLTIAGDSLYFLIGLVSTLWFGGMFGDQRMAALAGIAVMVVVAVAVHRLRAPAG